MYIYLTIVGYSAKSSFTANLWLTIICRAHTPVNRYIFTQDVSTLSSWPIIPEATSITQPNV